MAEQLDVTLLESDDERQAYAEARKYVAPGKLAGAIIWGVILTIAAGFAGFGAAEYFRNDGYAPFADSLVTPAAWIATILCAFRMLAWALERGSESEKARDENVRQFKRKIRYDDRVQRRAATADYERRRAEWEAAHPDYPYDRHLKDLREADARDDEWRYRMSRPSYRPHYGGRGTGRSGGGSGRRR
ncbi:hypothetical protein [Leifsonia sp. fls2-241-R2A-40a]|uniref:hypothetical protein n=1 Tax=Leifsonia sp. fls2-241-R2A-40a TaxID=3040290 RepID=UPI002550BB74|nr:hypothetical protein [Leifsonia sp. fls2-241-R2A-40a]